MWQSEASEWHQGRYYDNWRPERVEGEDVYAVGCSRMAGLCVWMVVSQKAGLYLPGGVSEMVVSLMLVATGLIMVAHGVYKSGTGRRGLLSAAQLSQMRREDGCVRYVVAFVCRQGREAEQQ